MYLEFSAHAYFRTRNSKLKSVSNKNQLEISRNLIRDNRIGLNFSRKIVGARLCLYFYKLKVNFEECLFDKHLNDFMSGLACVVVLSSL